MVLATNAGGIGVLRYGNARDLCLGVEAVMADGSLIEDSVVLPDVVIGRRVVLRRVIVDKRCVLPDGFKAGVCLEEDRARYHVTERGIVLITPEMLGQAAPLPAIVHRPSP